MRMINVVHLGIGPLGQKVVKYAVERGCFNIIGVVDTAPDKTGRGIATCAITLNAVRSVLNAAPGLKTMADIPSVAFFKEFQ